MQIEPKEKGTPDSVNQQKHCVDVFVISAWLCSLNPVSPLSLDQMDQPHSHALALTPPKSPRCPTSLHRGQRPRDNTTRYSWFQRQIKYENCLEQWRTSRHLQLTKCTLMSYKVCRCVDDGRGGCDAMGAIRTTTVVISIPIFFDDMKWLSS